MSNVLPFPPLLDAREWAEISESWGLSKRERQVAELLCQAAQYTTIEMRLGVAKTTVRSHVRAVYRKSRCRTRTELILTLVHGVLILKGSRPRRKMGGKAPP